MTYAPDAGVYNERTALAWQRTALALLAGAAIVARLTLDRLGWSSAVSVAAAIPVAGWVMWTSRRRYDAHNGARSQQWGRSGRSAAGLAGVTALIALTELAAITLE